MYFKDFNSLSQFPNQNVNLQTGETTPIVRPRFQIKDRISRVMELSSEMSILTITRRMSGNIGEEVSKKIFGKNVRRKKYVSENGFEPDFLLTGGDYVEVKTSRFGGGGGGVIKLSQLEKARETGKGYYVFVYYKTKNNKLPTRIVKCGVENTNQNIYSYFKKNVEIDSVFIFTDEELTYFYNTCGKKENIIRSKGETYDKYIGMSKKNALQLFNEISIANNDSTNGGGAFSFIHGLTKYKNSINGVNCDRNTIPGGIIPVYTSLYSPEFRSF